MKRSFVLLVAIGLSACSIDEDNDSRSSPNTSLNLQPIGNTTSIYSSRLGEITSLEKIVRVSETQLLILGETSTKAENGKLESFAAITNIQGEPITYQQNSLGYVDGCVHPSGEYSLGQFLASDDGQHTVEIQRFSPIGTLLHTTKMAAIYEENKYVIPANKEEWLNSPFDIVEYESPYDDQFYRQGSLPWGRFGIVNFNCDQESLFITYNDRGQKLTKYSPELIFEWETVLSIHYWGNSSRSSDTASVAIADNGQIYVIDSLTTDAIPAYNHRFSTQLDLVENKGQGESHILFKHLDWQGNVLNEKLIVSEQPQFVKSIALKNEQLFIGTHSRREKHNGNNNTTEWDVGLLTINTENYSHRQQWFHFDQDDWLNGFTLFENSLYFYGHSGGKQVDTNSWVVRPNAFYAKYNIESEQLESLKIINDLGSSEIKDLTFDGYDIYAVGVINGPITHSTDISRQGLFSKETVN